MTHLCRGYCGPYSGPCYHPPAPLEFDCECGQSTSKKCSDGRCDAGICPEHAVTCENCDAKCCQKCITWYAYGEFYLCKRCLDCVPADYEAANPRTEKEPA